MKRHICIGSQLYINRNDTPEHIRILVRKMKDAKLELIRLFMLWDSLEPVCGKWDFSVYDACFDEAQRCGLSVVPTLMPVSPPGWMKLTKGSQDIADIDDEKIWSAGLAYVSEVVRHYCTHPALHSWILWNEPSRDVKISASNINDFAAFLKDKYGSIEEYNCLHYRRFQNFSELTEYYMNAADSLAFKPYSDITDELDYSVYNLNCKLRDIADTVRRCDRVHPVHINPHDIVRGGYTDGQNFFEEAKVVDFLGCSAHPSWHSVDFRTERIPHSVGYFADVMKAASPGRFWITELQGGTNIFSGKTYLSPSASDIGMWLAEGFGSGAEAVVFWCFNTRDEGFEGGEWGLLNQLEQPSERLNEVTRFAEMIEKNRALFDASSPCAPDVFILYSDSTMRLNMIETRFLTSDVVRNRNNGKFSVLGAYTAVCDIGLSPALISEEQLVNSEIPDGSVLILPDTYALETGTTDAVLKFVRNGGTVIADGLCGMKTPDGRISKENLAVAEELFGAAVADISAVSSPCKVLFDGGCADAEFLKLRFELSSAVKHGDILVNDIGQGRAVRFPGIMFRRYFREENDFLPLLKKYIRINRNVTLLNPSKHLKMKALDSGKYRILFIVNCGNQPETAQISNVADYSVLSCHTADKKENLLNVRLSARDAAVVKIAPK